MNSDNFRAALRDAGLAYDGPLAMDGRLHRFKAAGDEERNSWFVLFPGPPVAGAFGCWKRGIKEKWHDGKGKLSPAEWTKLRNRWQEAERERKRVETERRQQARKTAAWILLRSKPLRSHDYLAAKGVKAFGDAREYRGALVLPLRDAKGELHSVQFIRVDGSKRFLTGGRIVACSFSLADKPDGPLVLCEGYATGASIHEAAGFAVVCAMNCGNLLAVAKALRARFPQREVILAADNDAWTDGNPGLSAATEAAEEIHGKLVVPQFAEMNTKPTDFNDLLQMEGLDTVKKQIKNATAPTETDDQAFARLVALTRPEYDRARDAEAERMGIRVGTLDAEVEKRRPQKEQPSNTIQPWAESVNGTDLLHALAAEYRKFLVLPPHADTVLALWTLHSYSWEQCEYSPIVAITSPVRSCGKSRVLAARRAWK